MVDAGRLRALLDRIADELAALRRLAAMSDAQLLVLDAALQAVLEDAARFRNLLVHGTPASTTTA